MTIAPWSSTGNSPTCEHCGIHVTDRFGRVYDDNSDRVGRCPDCDTYRRLTCGSATGIDVSIPDPDRRRERMAIRRDSESCLILQL
ncbi:hypothetical protein C477_14373 [Haloterrigena salina JCM 13891]|uniref:Small CPxCG-related zinc finger protein n=1 Tax=Haloterrigena salina JCM 13891 TaxID=1227488 RepID=M0C0K8_9EURY|nr:hypothetical protein C477_14373 [Haloterrigena salina JCM 13891]